MPAFGGSLRDADVADLLRARRHQRDVARAIDGHCRRRPAAEVSDEARQALEMDDALAAGPGHERHAHLRAVVAGEVGGVVGGLDEVNAAIAYLLRRIGQRQPPRGGAAGSSRPGHPRLRGPERLWP